MTAAAWASAIERSTSLVELEAIVEKGRGTFIEVGLALTRIRDARLYKSTHSSWEKYCQHRWGWGRNYADKLARSAAVAAELAEAGTIVPNEALARQLVSVPPEERAAVLAEAHELAQGGKPTAKLVDAVTALRGMTKDEQRALIQDFDPDVVIARRNELRRQKTRESFHSKESTEWYSPADPVELARALMRRIHLDPASSPEANNVIRADRIFTIEVDGLSFAWGTPEEPSNVWLNWPGGLNDDSESNAKLWSEKLLAEHRAGHVAQAVVMLFNAATDRGWFQPLWDFPICFVAGRLKFVRPGGEVGDQPLQPSGLVYIGPNVDEFVEHFGQMGHICLPGAGVSVGAR